MEKFKKSLVDPKHFKSRLIKLSYVSIVLGLINSTLHMNFTVVTAALTLIIIALFYSKNLQNTIKIIFKLGLLTFIVDKVKLIVISFYYFKEPQLVSYNSNLANIQLSNVYRSELQFLIKLYYFVDVIETLVNVYVMLMCYSFYKEKYSKKKAFSELIRIEYCDFNDKVDE